MLYMWGEKVFICGLAEDWVRKSQICEVPHLRSVRFLKSANLRIAELICGPPTFGDYNSATYPFYVLNTLVFYRCEAGVNIKYVNVNNFYDL